MKRIVLLISAMALAGCALIPANQPNSHEIVVRITSYDGATTRTTVEVYSGVPKMIGDVNAKVSVKTLGVEVRAATGTSQANTDAMITTLGGAAIGGYYGYPVAGAAVGATSGLGAKLIDRATTGTASLGN